VNQLPPGWAEVRLEQVADWGSGGTPCRSRSDFYGGTIAWIKTGELGQGLITDTEEKITEEALDNSSAKVFPKGSVAIAMYGATIGKVATLGIDAATNQACAVGIPFPGVTSTKYLLHYLASQKAEFVAKGQGGAQPNISQTIIKSWPIPLAPFREQERIAEKLDYVVTRIAICRERLDRVPQILKKFREAVLEAAVSGRLTEEWRQDHRLALDWAPTKLALIGELGRGKSKHRPRNDPHLYGGPYPFLQTGDVARSGGAITKHEQTYSEFGLAQSRLWPRDTLCITIAANIADTAILTYPACFPDSVVGFIADQAKCSPWFIKWSIDVRRDDLESFAPATAQKNINLAVLNDIEVPLPTPAEQIEIVRRVQDLLVLADSLRRRYEDTSSRVAKLSPSVLAKAFRGELVLQDPNDEPAGEMLERIRKGNGSGEVGAKSQAKAAREGVGGKAIQGGRRLRASSA
jgi:type I restriction enzyme, S subunit